MSDEDWLEGADQSVKDHPCMQNMKTSADLAKALVGVQSLIGADKIAVPSRDDDPNWGVLYKRLGRPDKHEDYQFGKIEGAPEDFVKPENAAKWKERFHAAGLSNKAADALYKDFVGDMVGVQKVQSEEAVNAKATTEKALRTELGQAYDSSIELASRTMKFLYGDKSQGIADSFGNNPDFIRGMIKAGNELSEDLLGAGVPKPGELTPDAAQKEINLVFADNKHAYFDENHPEHKWWVEDRMPQLQTQLNPGDVEA